MLRRFLYRRVPNVASETQQKKFSETRCNSRSDRFICAEDISREIPHKMMTCTRKIPTHCGFCAQKTVTCPDFRLLMHRKRAPINMSLLTIHCEIVQYLHSSSPIYIPGWHLYILLCPMLHLTLLFVESLLFYSR